MHTKLRSIAGAFVQFMFAMAGGGVASAITPTTADVQIGEPIVVENLSVFPVRTDRIEQAIELTTLEAALAKGDAEVSELGSGAEVNQLQIENKGKLPIYVLAGTVVEGRQAGSPNRPGLRDRAGQEGRGRRVLRRAGPLGRPSARAARRAASSRRPRAWPPARVRRAAQYEARPERGLEPGQRGQRRPQEERALRHLAGDARRRGRGAAPRATRAR